MGLKDVISIDGEELRGGGSKIDADNVGFIISGDYVCGVVRNISEVAVKSVFGDGEERTAKFIVCENARGESQGEKKKGVLFFWISPGMGGIESVKVGDIISVEYIKTELNPNTKHRYKKFRVCKYSTIPFRNELLD